MENEQNGVPMKEQNLNALTASTQSNIEPINPKSKTIKEILAERALEASNKIKKIDDNKSDNDLLRIKNILSK